MRQANVGIGEYYGSHAQAEVIKTFGLGSCVGVMIFGTTRKVAGLIHVAHPD